MLDACRQIRVVAAAVERGSPDICVRLLQQRGYRVLTKGPTARVRHNWWCRAPSRTYSYAGDTGALVSIGLLRNISFAAMEECILKQWNSGESCRPPTPA